MTHPPPALICMNCGFAHLHYRHCKILCQNCGFMLDCSDLDVGGEVQRAQRRIPSAPPDSHPSPQAGQDA